jgi:hypothetical protein
LWSPRLPPPGFHSGLFSFLSNEGRAKEGKGQGFRVLAVEGLIATCSGNASRG